MNGPSNTLVKLCMIVAILAATSFTLTACDVSARWDLRRAEKMLKKADKANAERWAEKEYRKAQGAFEEAMALSRVRNVNEARDKALVAHEWAEEALTLSLQRKAEMDEERDALGAYQD